MTRRIDTTPTTGTDRVLQYWEQLKEIDKQYGVALDIWKKSPTEENRLAACEIHDKRREVKDLWQAEREKE